MENVLFFKLSQNSMTGESKTCGLHKTSIFRFSGQPASAGRNPPAPKVLGRDLPDGTRKRLQVYLGGWHFSAKTSCFWWVVTLAFKKHCKKQYGRHLFVNAPVQNRQAKSEKTPCFSTFWPQFFGLQHLFLRFRRWPGPEADFWVFGPVFGLIFVVLW